VLATEIYNKGSDETNSKQQQQEALLPRRAQRFCRACWCTLWHFSGENLL